MSGEMNDRNVIQSEVDAMLLSPDPTQNPIFQKLTGQKLSHGGGIEMLMRNQVLKSYGSTGSYDFILTSTEFREKQEVEREAIVAIEKAKLAAAKAQAKGLKEDLVTVEVSQPAGDVKSTHATPPPKEELKEEVLPETPKPVEKKKKRLRPAAEPVTVEPEVLKPVPKTESVPFVSLWEKYADEGPPDVGVETDVAPPRPPYEFKAGKTYNINLQVRPKDIAKVTMGLDAYELKSGLGQGKYKIMAPTIKPKMVNASAMVRAKPKIGEPPFKSAFAQAQPRGYRVLKLSDQAAPIQDDKDTQVTEMEIEKSNALSRGISLRDGNVLWPTIMEFNYELAEIKIKTYIRNFWKLGPDWMYDMRFLQTHTTNYRKKFVFELIFSKPTNECPVPPATASVFFVFEAEHYDCPDQMMKVQYVLEGNRYPYTPGTVEFREEWISGIIEDKIRIQKSIHL